MTAMPKSSRTAAFLSLIGIMLGAAILFRVLQWWQASQATGTAYLVLGGNPIRELYAAELKRQHPQNVVLISGGSEDPCLYLLWQKSHASMDGVWAEHCSKNTFENFVYSLPILEKLGARRVSVISDYPQLDRAMPIARILFGSHGMAVAVQQSPGYYPGDKKSNYEIMALTALSVVWALSSQFYQPNCAHVTRIVGVDMNSWYKHGFDCQQQTGVPSQHPAGATPRQ